MPHPYHVMFIRNLYYYVSIEYDIILDRTNMYIAIYHHFFDIFDDLEIADPPDFTEMEPLDDIISTELGALL